MIRHSIDLCRSDTQRQGLRTLCRYKRPAKPKAVKGASLPMFPPFARAQMAAHARAVARHAWAA